MRALWKNYYPKYNPHLGTFPDRSHNQEYHWIMCSLRENRIGWEGTICPVGLAVRKYKSFEHTTYAPFEQHHETQRFEITFAPVTWEEKTNPFLSMNKSSIRLWEWSFWSRNSPQNVLKNWHCKPNVERFAWKHFKSHGRHFGSIYLKVPDVFNMTVRAAIQLHKITWHHHPPWSIKMLLDENSFQIEYSRSSCLQSRSIFNFRARCLKCWKLLKSKCNYAHVRSRTQDILSYSWDIKNFSRTVSWQSELGKQYTLILWVKCMGSRIRISHIPKGCAVFRKRKKYHVNQTPAMRWSDYTERRWYRNTRRNALCIMGILKANIIY